MPQRLDRIGRGGGLECAAAKAGEHKGRHDSSIGFMWFSHPHSLRNATIGSTRSARRAGSQAARPTLTPSTATTAR